MKNRANILNSFVRYMTQNDSVAKTVLQEKFSKIINEKDFDKFLRWMEAGSFIEIHGNTTVIWKGNYQVSPSIEHWAFCSFNG